MSEEWFCSTKQSFFLYRYVQMHKSARMNESEDEDISGDDEDDVLLSV